LAKGAIIQGMAINLNEAKLTTLEQAGAFLARYLTAKRSLIRAFKLRGT
jgi:hypothetical protein